MKRLISNGEALTDESDPPHLIAGNTTIMLLPRNAQTGNGAFSTAFTSKIVRILTG